MKRFDYTFGTHGKVLAEMSIHQDIGMSRLGDHGWLQEVRDAAMDLLASLQVIYGGDVILLHCRIVDSEASAEASCSKN
jgi:hypothetical protein